MNIRCVTDRRTGMLLFMYIEQGADAKARDLAPPPPPLDAYGRWEADCILLPLFVGDISDYPCSSCPSLATHAEPGFDKPKARPSRYPSEVEELLAQTIQENLWCSCASIRTVYVALHYRIAAINQSRPAEEQIRLPSKSTVARRIKVYKQRSFHHQAEQCWPCTALPDVIMVDRGKML
jgi:hypothetical protein